MDKYQNLSKEELLKLVEKQEKELASKKYGLVWDAEREPEQVVLDCANNLPVLKRVKGKEIKTDDSEDNILIEGDNYHALTVLNYTHKEKIDVIYIDPPYNTGNKDFKYNDRFVDKTDSHSHSKWLNFMEKRLNLAKNLLKKTGVIFISIDDHEMAQLKLLCDRIFGEENFIGNIIWHKKDNASFLSKRIVNLKEYILFYTKSKSFLGTQDKLINIERHRELITKPSKLQERIFLKRSVLVENGKFSGILKKGKYGNPQFEMEILENIKIKNGNPQNNIKIKGKFCWSQKTIDKEVKNGGHIEIKSISGMKPIFYKNFGKNIPFRPIVDIFSKIFDDRVKTTQDADRDLKKLFGDSSIFDYSKPKELMEILIGSVTRNGENYYHVLDFMAGSGTTGHAVLDLNKKDDGNRKFILCTNNELNGFEKELKEKGMSEKEIQEYGICRRVTYPRIGKVIKGYKKNGNGEKVEGLGGNLQYFRTGLVKETKSKVQIKIDLTQKCAEMLCVKENIFNLETKQKDFKIFSSNKKDKFLCVYFNFLENSFDDFLTEMQKLKSEKIIYMFSLKNKIKKSLFSGVENKKIKPIPQEILTVYEELVRKNIPIKKEIIFLELKKARKKVFEEKEKDDGAKNLRIVLEKILQKIAQQNGISFLGQNGKEEKISITNDKLKSKKIISQVAWEENKTYLTIGNDAMHGKYDDFDLDQIENFYKHTQSLINKFNF